MPSKHFLKSYFESFTQDPVQQFQEGEEKILNIPGRWRKCCLCKAELMYQQNAWNDVQCLDKCEKAHYVKHCLCQHCITQSNTKDSVFWLAQMKSCDVMLRHFSLCLTECHFRWPDKHSWTSITWCKTCYIHALQQLANCYRK